MMSGWKGNPDFEEAVEKVATEHIRKIAMKALRGVVIRTPVDTGRLRSNWQTGINGAPRGTLNTATNSALSKGGAILKSIDMDTHSIYIVNNLPYAVRIEEGHGGRSPGVMVAATLAVLKLS